MAQVILGGGISGLAAAYYLRLRDPKSKIILLEASNRLGGWINSVCCKDGTLLELGPRTLRAVGNPGANTLALAEDLGLSDKIKFVTYNHPAAKNRLICVGDKLHQLPNSLKTAMKTLPPFTKPLLMHALSDISKPKVINNDESLYSFVNRRFGSEVAKYAIDPLARGVFAGNAKDLSIMSLGKRLHEVEQKFGSVITGLIKDRKNGAKVDPNLLKSKLVQKSINEKWSVWSLDGGLKKLVDSLLNNLKNDVEIKLSTPATSLEVTSNNVFEVHTKDGQIEAKNIISCLPSNQMKSLAKHVNLDLYNILNNIHFATVAVVNLVYKGNLINNPAFGYLVPSSEPSKVLGVIYDSCVFPQGDKTIFTVMMGGYWFNEYFGESFTKDQFLDVAVKELAKTLKINDKPILNNVSILEECIPQYTVGHFERVYNARKLIKDLNLPLHLAGNSYDGVGVNDAIMSAKSAVSSLNRH